MIHPLAEIAKLDSTVKTPLFSIQVRWIRGCGILDFPLYDKIQNRVNRLALLRHFLFRVELLLGCLPWLAGLSRHLIVVAELDGAGGQVGE